FTVDDVPDLTGRVALVTGGNRGCGFVAAKALALHGARVYIASRDDKKCQTAADKIKEEVGGKNVQVIALKMDLSDLESVAQAAKVFLSKEKTLHILILNAAVQEEPATARTKQGYGLHFGINVLGHFLLTQYLVPTLLSTAQTTAPGSVRIVTVASSAHYFAPAPGIDFSSLGRRADQLCTDQGKAWSPNTCYGHSKLANILVSNERARRYADNGVYCLSLHPGNILTSDEDSWLAVSALTRSLLWPADPYGAINMLYCATAPAAQNGAYVVPWARAHPPHPHAQDTAMAAQLWAWLEAQVRAFEARSANPNQIN
ncbi:NAD-binding protein, partial [Athelia psychrophila]